MVISQALFSKSGFQTNALLSGKVYSVHRLLIQQHNNKKNTKEILWQKNVVLHSTKSTTTQGTLTQYCFFCLNKNLKKSDTNNHKNDLLKGLFSPLSDLYKTH